MPQSPVFPLRYGLQIPTQENMKAVEVFSEGGLDLTQSIIENRPGCAADLVNFEASLTGGYQRILGFEKYSTTVVPGQGDILGAFVLWPNQVIAARQDATHSGFYNIYYGSGTTWTQINPSTTTQTGSINAPWAANQITNATWASTSGGEATFTTLTNHGVTVGATFTISGMVPVGWNGTYIAITGTSGSTLVAALASNPGFGNQFVATMTSATPCVVTVTGVSLSTTIPVALQFQTTGSLYTGLTANTTYWSAPSSVSGTSFSVASSYAHALVPTEINTSGSESGTQTATFMTLGTLNAGAGQYVWGLTTTGLIPGQPVSGTSITTGSLIESIVNSTTIQLTLPVTTTEASETITFSNPLTYSSGMVLQSCYYNWTGAVRLAIFDGVNYAYRYDSTSGQGMVILTGTTANPAPSNPQFGAEFFGYLVIGGFSSNSGAIAYCAPYADTDWSALDGAAEIVVGNTVTGLREWRQQLIIFSVNGIDRMIQNTLNTTGITPPPPFQIQPVTNKVGCIAGRTIQECNGDLLYLAQDGIRTISGTFNIGDTEIGSISRPIQSIVNAINTVTTPCHSLVIHKKTQYRLFYPNYSLASTSSLGIMGSVRRFRDGHEGWEWGEIIGIQPTCCDSQYLIDGNEYVIHGGTDGYIYRQEQGVTFNGAPVNESYITVPLELGDIGLRKALHRITVYISTEGGTTNLNLSLIYNYNNPGTINPPSYALLNVGNSAVLYDSGVLYNSGAVYGVIANTTIRQLVQGSGFTVQLQLNYAGDASASTNYVIQGYYIEYFPSGRR